MEQAASVARGLEDPAWLRANEVIFMFCVPMALRAAIRLKVMEILASCGNAELSSEEIVWHMKDKYKLPISNPAADITLDRILRILASEGIISSSLAQHVEGGPGLAQQLPVRRYGLNAVSRYLASGPEVGAPSLAAFSMMLLHKAFSEAWPYVEQAVMEGGVPFQLAHGKSAFLFQQDEDPEFGELYNTAMSNHSSICMEFLLQSYEGFGGVKTLVDVGGCRGACLHAIVSKYPHIKGINFDQPHVIASACAQYPDLEHVGGDMFESVPQGDAIFLKWVLHNWSDELCVKLLKNCYRALPKHGKVIVVDGLLPPTVETTSRARINYNIDLMMYTFFQGGTERNLQAMQELAAAAGFAVPQVVAHVNELTVIELRKL
ncbi:hypothetical protein L7F22_029088 [Adiantum nelumboides]|nr:hypothetical protein [Adiantum nelumboides]